METRSYPTRRPDPKTRAERPGQKDQTRRPERKTQTGKTGKRRYDVHSIRMRTAAVLLGTTAALCLAAPAQSFADSGTASKAAYCGTDQSSGLAVSATRNVSCATAVQAAAAYTKVWQGKAGKPVQVRAGGVTWECQERQGDPNPYQVCVDSQDKTRLVTLSS
jgi:hypothetical protein